MKKTTTNKPERKQVGIHVDVQLWRKFRARALEQGVEAGRLVEQLIAEYLETKQQQDKGI